MVNQIRIISYQLESSCTNTGWTHLSIGAPVYAYNTKRFKYDGGFILSLPNNPYKSDFVNLTNYRHLLKYGTVTLSWNAPTSNFNLHPTYYDHANDNTKFQFNERGRSPIKQKLVKKPSHQHSHRMLGVHSSLYDQESYPSKYYDPQYSQDSDYDPQHSKESDYVPQRSQESLHQLNAQQLMKKLPSKEPH